MYCYRLDFIIGVMRTNDTSIMRAAQRVAGDSEFHVLVLVPTSRIHVCLRWLVERASHPQPNNCVSLKSESEELSGGGGYLKQSTSVVVVRGERGGGGHPDASEHL